MTVSDGEEGLFVFVRDGHIEIATANEILPGQGRGRFRGRRRGCQAARNIPKFIDFDRVPMPMPSNPFAGQRVGRSGVEPNTRCR